MIEHLPDPFTALQRSWQCQDDHLSHHEELLPVLLPEFFFVDELPELVLVVLLLPGFLLSFPPQAVADTAIIATIPKISPFFINPFIFFSAVFLFCIFFVLSFL